MTIKTLVFTAVFAITGVFAHTASAADFVMSTGYSPVIQDIEKYRLTDNNPFLMASSTPERITRVGIRREMYVASTGYNSLPEQTDDSPFTAADGTHVFDGMVAANFLPFKTKIKIPDYYGDKVFIVHDRMNKRYTQRVDIWFEHKPDALKWGVRNVRIQILGN